MRAISSRTEWLRWGWVAVPVAAVALEGLCDWVDESRATASSRPSASSGCSTRDPPFARRPTARAMWAVCVRASKGRRARPSRQAARRHWRAGSGAERATLERVGDELCRPAPSGRGQRLRADEPVATVQATRRLGVTARDGRAARAGAGGRVRAASGRAHFGAATLVGWRAGRPCRRDGTPSGRPPPAAGGSPRSR